MFGTFDLLHPGHRFVLNEAQKRGRLSVVIARDTNVQRIKGRFPVHDEDERISNVRSVVPDAEVALGDAHDFLVPVRAINPDLILLGYDQALPTGVREEDLPCEIERLPAFEPEKYKSSILRNNKT